MQALAKNSFNEAAGTSKITFIQWIKTKSPDLQNFYWQDGYGAFSVNSAEADRVIRYIERQHEHHAKKSFQDEYRAILKKYQMDCDERYIWD